MAEDMKTAAKNVADRAGDLAKPAKDSAQDTAAQASSVAQDYASQASSKASDLYGNAKTSFSSMAEQLPNSTSDAMESGQKAYRSGNAALGKHVSKQPIEALLLAGAIGYLVGWAANRS